MPEKLFRPGEKHPEPWREDLNPDAMAGQNIGTAGPHPELDARTAYDVKALHRRLVDFTDDELKQIPVLPQGSRLEQEATYIDLRAEQPVEFTARGDEEAGPQNWYVPKAVVPYPLWNRLLSVRNLERLETPARGGGNRPIGRENATTAPAATTCAHCGVPIVDPTTQRVHGDRTYCCANCSEAMEQQTGGSDPHAPDHPGDLRCAHCGVPIVDESSMESRGDDAFCCRNCAAAMPATTRGR